jgi:hypothetical protein
LTKNGPKVLVAAGRTRDGRDLLNVDAPKVPPPALDFEIVRSPEWPDAKRTGTDYKPFPLHKRAIYVTDFYNLAPFRQALIDINPPVPIDGGVKTEIEPLERLAEIDGRAPESQLQLFLRAALDFVLDETLQEIDVGELRGDGLLRADLQRGQDARQP